MRLVHAAVNSARRKQLRSEGRHGGRQDLLGVPDAPSNNRKGTSDLFRFRPQLRETGARKFRFFDALCRCGACRVRPAPVFSRGGRFRSSCGGHPFERRQPSHNVGKVLQADLEACPDDPDGRATVSA